MLIIKILAIAFLFLVSTVAFLSFNLEKDLDNFCVDNNYERGQLNKYNDYCVKLDGTTIIKKEVTRCNLKDANFYNDWCFVEMVK